MERNLFLELLAVLLVLMSERVAELYNCIYLLNHTVLFPALDIRLQVLMRSAF